MNPSRAEEPELERQHGRFRKPASWFLMIAAAIEVPGILLFVLTHSGFKALGIALMGLGLPVLLVGLGLLGSSLVAGWAAHRKPFA